jgi:hypothetical protein
MLDFDYQYDFIKGGSKVNYGNLRKSITCFSNGLLGYIDEIERESKISLFLSLALRYLDSPYIWSGNDPLTGSDCSGFICYLLHSHGIISQTCDLSAKDLYEKFPSIQNASAGCLCFYGIPIITHVTLALNEYVCIGACGGDSSVCTPEIAMQKKARIKVLPIHYRSDLSGFNTPFSNLI